MSSFEQILENVKRSANGWTAEITEDWAQGRAVYGGMAAALAARAMRLAVGPDYPLRSLLVSFAGPVAPGQVNLSAEVLRNGSSVANLEARLVQEGKTRCVALGSYGLERPSEINLADLRRPDLPGPEGLESVPYIHGVMPRFMQHFDVRWALGAPPLSGADSNEIGGWFRFAETVPTPGEEWWVALADVWPTPLLSMIKGPAIFSSLTWGLDFSGFDSAQPLDGWWAYRATAESAAGGYGQCRAEIWSPAGGLVMHSRQTVVLFSNGQKPIQTD